MSDGIDWKANCERVQYHLQHCVQEKKKLRAEVERLKVLLAGRCPCPHCGHDAAYERPEIGTNAWECTECEHLFAWPVGPVTPD